ncbi:MAG: hypothetical protein PG978_000350 [Wolbachia endosymbiont of Ctenocephalides felis wCfeF]|nr:MAG: hypothetical protein PG978_000350 [Wolbachia endosymbiont of Ctenocephalides felis wCfeF]
MRNLLKKPESVYDIIFETVTKNREAVQESAKKCKQLFKQKKDPADPNVLIELEEVLRARQDEEALAKLIKSNQVNNPKTPDELKESLEKQKEDYEYYIEDFLSALKKEITKSEELGQIKRIKIEKIITEIQISDGLRNSQISRQDNAGTPELNDGPGSRASSPVPSEKSPPQSPIRSSVNPTLNHAKKDSDSQIKNKEKTKLEHPTKTRPKGPIGRRLPSKWIKGRVQSEQPAKEEPKKQENENNSEYIPPEKQPNNRNFRIALAKGCALSAIGCLIAGVVTLGMVGAGLLVMSVVLAIAAAVTRYLTPPSSELTSTDLSPLIDDGKQR